ncbi:MAG TPA: spore germination protein [Firmicutes bacterium]|nr:spore germination protein [Bacillota bacterium]
MLGTLWRLLFRRIAGVRGSGGTEPRRAEVLVSADLSVNRERIESAFGNSPDLVTRELRAGARGRISVLVTHIDGLVDKRLIAEAVVERITGLQLEWTDPAQAYEDLKTRLLASSDVEEVETLGEFISGIARGDGGVLVDGVAKGLVCALRGWEQRSVEEPTTESTVRGSKEGFVEALRTNTSLLRRRIVSPQLWIEEVTIGRITRTRVAIAYIAGVVNEDIVEEVRARLKRIDVDAIHESGNIEELIEDAPFSPFPTIARTERPDRVAGALIDGRVAILTDGTPFVLIVPATFTMFLTSSEDYYERYFAGSAIRLLRIAAFFISLTLPAFYVALTTYHQEMLPTPLVLSIAAQREGIPFPAVVEALLMEFVFETLREAGIRLPRVVGQAVSIIGALVVGDAAIRAGLASPAMVMVVAFTGIASFATPVFSLAISVRLLRFVMTALGGALGFFGVAMGMFALLTHLTCLRSFGVPYLEPLAPLVLSDLKDALVRVPWWAMSRRPEFTGKKAPIRQAPGLKPRPPSPEREEVQRLLDTEDVR